ncbi:MAG TPA: OmpA family protein, partial [Flavobacteriales bacterium]|nr:OmpA family protein [Flavobacteriales bacterium]
MATGLAAQVTTTPVADELMVHFPLASAVPDAADVTRLRALCDRADMDGVVRITLTGHTDVRGSVAYNENLSERRAEAVKAELRNTCLRDVAVAIEWAGELIPLARGDSDKDHASNRRVLVKLIRSDPVNDASTALGASRRPHIVPLLPGIDVKAQVIEVDPARPIDVIMDDGVRVRIPANAIVDERGALVTGPVDLNYRSFSEPYEIIASGIPMHVRTDEGTQHMETAGMYELFATQNGKELALAPGERITLERPV